MKKIMFNDRFGLTQAVLDGRKTQTRRIIKVQPPYNNFDIAFPVFVEDDWPPKNLLYGAFCWVNKDNPKEYTDWIRPAFKDGEVVAVAQSYTDCGNLPDYELDEDGYPIMPERSGFFNKMFVRADLMPYQIRITNVRIQRLQDISDEDCLKEGIADMGIGGSLRYSFAENVKQINGDNITFLNNFATAKEAFAALIDKVSGKGTWKQNPYVFVYDFELVK